MAKSLEKIRALQMRGQGMSIRDIAVALNISRGTSSLWCREVVLSAESQALLRKRMIDAGHIGRMMGAEANRKKKQSTILLAAKYANSEIKNLSRRDVMMIALGLYWGEGSKDSHSRFVFVNSDPKAINFIIEWLCLCMGVQKESLQLQVYINEQHTEREPVVLNFWSKKLSISSERFRRTIFIKAKHKKVYENHDSYMGVMHLAVAKSSFLKYQTMALLSEIQGVVQKI